MHTEDDYKQTKEISNFIYAALMLVVYTLAIWYN